jgi:hypothetical protein
VGGDGRQEQAQEQETQQEAAAADSGSPSGSSSSGSWQERQQRMEAAAASGAAGSDVDSDVVLLHPQQQEAAELAKAGTGGGDSARSQDSAWVGTPPAGAEAPAGGSKAAAAVPVLPQLRRVQQQSAAVGATGQGQPGGMQREGSGNLEWISAVGKEWLNVRARLPGCSAVCKRGQLCCCWFAPLSDLPSVVSCCAVLTGRLAAPLLHTHTHRGDPAAGGGGPAWPDCDG